MKKLTCILTVLFLVGLLAGCGDDVADDPNLSEEGKAIVEEVGGPFDASEFKKFLADLPKIPGLTGGNQKNLGEISGEALSAQIMSAVDGLGWDQERFMYIYSHTMTVVNAEHMNTALDNMRAQFTGMPEDQKKAMEDMIAKQMGGQMEAFQAELDKQVPASEQEIVKDNLQKIYSVLGIQY